MTTSACLRGFLAAISLAAIGVAQGGGDEHASHHGGQKAGAASQPSATNPGAKGGMGKGGMGMGAKGGMGKGGMGKGVPSEKTELVPMFMNLGEVTPERVAEIQALARARAAAGIRHMRHSMDDMLTAFDRDDLAGVEASVARVRDGLSQFESGIAAARALAERRAPQNTALQWLRRELDLVPPPTPRGGLLWGFSGMHLFFMVLAGSVAFGGLVLYSRRTRRASQLIEQLATPTAEVPAAAAKAPKAPKAAKAAKAALPDAAQAGGANPDVDEISSGLVPVKRRKHCKMRVTRIIQETPDVKTFRLVACDRGRIGFGYLPGQFLTVTLPTGGEKPVRRSYTISSSPTQAFYCEFTVKREDQGIGSRYLHDEVKEGDALQVQAPSGKFTFTGEEAESIVLIAGGVGITPMMSITRALTDMGWLGEIYFIAATRDPDHLIFRAELDRLKQLHPNLHVHVAASRLQGDVEGFEKGRLDKNLLARWVPDIGSRWVHLCGAPPMMASTKEMLVELDVPGANIHIESFGSEFKPRAKKKERQQVAATGKATGAGADTEAVGVGVRFQTSDKSTTFLLNETVLEAAERVGVDIDNSCRSGMCGVCAIKLISGDVEMESDEGLEPDDEEAGKILACVSRCSSDIVVDA